MQPDRSLESATLILPNLTSLLPRIKQYRLYFFFFISDGFYAIYQADLFDAVFSTLSVMVQCTVKISAAGNTGFTDGLRFTDGLPIKDHGSPRRGTGLRAIPTLGFAACYRRDARTLKIDGFCDFQLHPFHIGKGLG
jgi:hypothetical protein